MMSAALDYAAAVDDEVTEPEIGKKDLLGRCCCRSKTVPDRMMLVLRNCLQMRIVKTTNRLRLLLLLGGGG